MGLTKDINNERFRIFDILKGIAIIFVVITHYHFTESQRLTYLFPYWIGMAVPMFMIITGCLYSHSFVKNKIDTFEKAYNATFVGNKIIRLTIPFLIILFIELLTISTKKWHISLFFQGGTGPGSYYYPLMIQLIFLFPLLYFYMQRHKNISKALFNIFILNLIFEILKTAYHLNLDAYRLLIFRYAFYICCGIYIYIYTQRYTMDSVKNLNINYKKWLGPLVLGIAYIYLCAYTDYKPKIFNFWSATSMLSALYFVPIFYFVVTKFQRLSNPVLELIGKSSWNIFLFQMFFYRFKTTYIYDKIQNPILQISLCLLICLVAGILFYLVESKITRKIKSLLNVSLHKLNNFFTT